MSDYISIKDDRLWDILFDEACVEGKQAERIQKELEQISVDEKEIIRKAFERVLTRLEEYWRTHKAWEDYEMFNGTYIEMLQHEKVVKAYEKAIKIVKEECGINE